MRQQGLLLLFFGALLLLLLAAAAGARRRPVQLLVQRAPAAEAPPVSSLVLLPLSHYAGVFEVDLAVGGSAVKAVFDTGSENLIVAGSECVRSNQCSAGGGHYEESPERATGKTTTVQYGTQTDQVRWYRDDVSLSVVRPRTLQRVAAQEECRMEGLDDKPDDKVAVPGMAVGVVRQRSGVSNLNVLGFCQTGSSSEGGCLRTLLGPAGVFALVVHQKRGWLALGGPPPLAHCPRVRRLPLVRAPGGMLGYYVVAVAQVEVWRKGKGKGKGGERRRRRCRHLPRYAIIDTGSNMLSVSAPLLRELRENGLGTPQAHLSLTLGSGGDTAELDYGYRDYAMGGELLVRDNLPFDRDDVILLGTLFMRGRYVEFDLQRRTLGLAQLQGTTPCPEGGCPAPVVRTQRPR